VDWTNQPCGTLDRGVRYLSICSAVLQSCAVLLCIYTYISLINNQPHIFSIPHIFSTAEVWSSCNRKSIALFIRAVQIRSSASLTSQTSTLLLRFLGGRESPTTPARGNSQSSLNTTVPTFQPSFHNSHSSPNFTMCDYTQVEFRCGHVRYTVRAWCTNYETTHKRCPPSVVAIEFR
jgi:hypothetical protein